MNKGRLEVVKLEMARVNINTLGISELKWTGMGEFNSDDHYICYCEQESLRRNGVVLIINKGVQNAVLGYNLKNNRMILVHFQSKPFNITAIQVFAQITDVGEVEVDQFCENPQDLIELTPKTRWFKKKKERKDILFLTGDWNAKIGSQRIPGVTGKFGLGVQNKVEQRLRVLSREHTGQSKHPLPTT